MTLKLYFDDDWAFARQRVSKKTFPAEGTAVPKDRRQEFDSPRYLGVAGSGLKGRDG